MSETIRVVGISGSLRRASWNSGLLREAVKLAPEGMQVQILDIASIPLFNQDQENDPPAPVREFKAQIADADAVLFAVPEYNYSLPGVLKNAIDWASRPVTTQPFYGKPVAMMGAGGRFGTVRAQAHLRQVGVFLNFMMVNKPEVMIPLGADKFDADGNLTDDTFRPMIADLLKALAKLTIALRAG
jgi:chromate reductase